MGQPERHPRGLYVLFATEMWERFSFYSMLAMFTLYLQDPVEGFSWTKAQATSLYSNDMMFVYASPLVGGLLADWKLGYRRAVMLGGLFFMAGHLLLSFRSLAAVYAALTCLVIGNGFFKPNVSTMVGNLYPEGSPLKDRAYNIFYMGINVGALLAPLTMAWVRSAFGFHPAFAVAAFGMVISVATLWWFRGLVEDPERQPRFLADAGAPARPPSAIDAVPESKRILALLAIYATVIVFWMVFHQNGSTLTYWANDNTDWDAVGIGPKARGILSNAINAAWVIILTFPLIGLWKWLGQWNLEPSTPMKMVYGMLLTAASFGILWYAARFGEGSVTGELVGDNRYAFRVSFLWLIAAYGVVTLGELMLSPMGLSLVSKVAPQRFRGLMMGGWFVATAIGNKLTMIGVYWTEWLHSTFFAVMAGAALAAGMVLLVFLRPLKQAMPGV
ncbi:MAG: peptide MFS transporter [Planctomycetia bacterium]|nr:peptide MFS transporter [Planctomycetia bacterium]